MGKVEFFPFDLWVYPTNNFCKVWIVLLLINLISFDGILFIPFYQILIKLLLPGLFRHRHIFSNIEIYCTAQHNLRLF